VSSGHKSVTVTLAGVTTSSLILATMQQILGSITVLAAVPAAGSFTITLTGAPTGNVKVAWFVIN